MGSRELVILLLGFAVVAVILRGLWVALRVRRGQIKLAIDKNIPQDVDLEAMELSELPSGGARVVTRSLQEVNSQNTALDAANQRAQVLELGDDTGTDTIPVLMDTVELAPEVHPTDSAAYSDEPSVVETAETEQLPTHDHEDPDDVLFDYDQVIPGIGEMHADEAVDERTVEDPRLDDGSAENVQDGLAGVAPDYPEELDQQAAEMNHESGEGFANEAPQFHDSAPVERSQEPGGETTVDAMDSDYADEQIGWGERLERPPGDDHDGGPGDTVENDERHYQDPALGSEVQFDSHLDEFSMTAGERIGDIAIAADESQQSSLFDEPAPAQEEQEEKPKKRSLFAAFTRKKKSPPPEPDVPPVPEAPKVSEATVVTLAEEPVETEATPRAEHIEAPQEIMQPSEVIVINVMAREGYAFAGHDLLQVLITAGLKFGDMSIFHQRFGNDNNGPVVFSVANILNPGTFDLNNMDNFSTLGISLFLALPAAISNQDAFEQMLTVAQQVRGALDGELKDDHRNVMTEQTIEHYRQRIRDFELRQLKSASSRG
ncbi:MAG TPA: cell division protein ZipA [Gammaproteobacteria bacterium]|jgi:cell division protein ZipA|nr:cell division protein ZipA [Gammaproteobacteria bacterium]MDP6733836.1 cell division protein ZipA [Gammaproteobacteria bacterium]HAJ76153.1 cell division protein ZipA [Gammaproteobacteria bacterium]|tara:strand:+ start:254 stop:1891 length:1638 start_codon:yes stop_codon:yes gene_type:complete